MQSGCSHHPSFVRWQGYPQRLVGGVASGADVCRVCGNGTRAAVNCGLRWPPVVGVWRVEIRSCGFGHMNLPSKPTTPAVVRNCDFNTPSSPFCCTQTLLRNSFAQPFPRFSTTYVCCMCSVMECLASCVPRTWLHLRVANSFCRPSTAPVPKASLATHHTTPSARRAESDKPACDEGQIRDAARLSSAARLRRPYRPCNCFIATDPAIATKPLIATLTWLQMGAGALAIVDPCSR
jgi:hypothetical protein